MGSSTSSGSSVNDIVRGAKSNNEDHGISGSFLGKYYMRIAIGKYLRPKPFGLPQFEPNIYLFLPLPRMLQDITAVGYSDDNLGSVGDYINGATGASGASAAAILRASGSMISGIGAFGASAGSSAARATETTAGNMAASGIDALASVIGNAFQADQMTSAIQQNAGLAPNPNPSVSFTGPVLRSFTYDWSFYPKNKQESLAIQRMIRILKRSALPRNAIEESAAILAYPDMCQLNFYPWDKGGSGNWGWRESSDDDAGSIIRYKKCVMQDVSVSYSAGGSSMAFFEGTNLPTSYELNIQFKEIEYMLSEDWKESSIAALGEPFGVGGNIAAAGQINGSIDRIARAVGQGSTQVGLQATIAGANITASLAIGATAGVVADTALGAGGALTGTTL